MGILLVSRFEFQKFRILEILNFHPCDGNSDAQPYCFFFFHVAVHILLFLSEWFAASNIIEGHGKSPPAPRRVELMNITGKPRYFPCPDCGKIFPSNAKLKVHYMTHTGAKPHKCQFCDRSFRQRPHLKSHMYISHQEELIHGKFTFWN